MNHHNLLKHIVPQHKKHMKTHLQIYLPIKERKQKTYRALYVFLNNKFQC